MHFSSFNHTANFCTHLWIPHDFHENMLVPLFDNIFIAVNTESQPADSSKAADSQAQYIQLDTILSSGLATAQLVCFNYFCEQLQVVRESANSEAKIFICTDSYSGIYLISKFAGSHNILYRGLSADAVLTNFQGSNALLSPELKSSVQEKELSLHNSWRAIERSKNLGWFVDPDSEIEPILDIDEFAHYASVANGSVHLALPGELFFFPSPEDLPDNQDWIDVEREDGRAARRFSPAYYAALLDDLGVSCVVCLGRSDPAAAAAFAARGLATEDLGLAADGSSLLRGLDRLLSLARAAPGALAVHSGEGFA